MKYTLLILFTFGTLSASAGYDLAIIHDADGFTNIRSGPGTHFKVIDTLFNEDFFYYEIDECSDWAKLTAWKGSQIEGYIHTSRIQQVSRLDSKKQKTLITKILIQQRKIAGGMRNSKDSLDRYKYAQERNFYNDAKYEPVLQVLPHYFCATRDTQIIDLFFETMWADKGSASEIPGIYICDCFVCNPDLVSARLNKLQSKEQKLLILDKIAYGLMEHFQVDQDGNSSDKKYNELMARVSKLRD